MPGKKRGALVLGLVAAGLLAMALSTPSCFKREAVKPGLILITLDTVRQDHLSAYGYSRPTSPNLEKFSQDAATFTNVYAPLPSTWPSHFAMMTSTPPAVLGVLVNGQRPSFASAGYLAQHLREQGFATAAIVGSEVFKPGGGLETGFDRFDNDPPRHSGSGRTRPNQYARGADQVVDLAIDWLKQRPDDRPFFLWLHFWDAHVPYYAPPEYLDKFSIDDGLVAMMRERRQSAIFSYKDKSFSTPTAINQYDGAIAFIDAELGRFFQYLKDEGLYNPLLIAVTADHGEGLMEHDIYIHGPVIYQSSVLVPLFLHLPDAAFAGKRIDAPASLLDLVPTCLGALELPPLPGAFGLSLTPALKGAGLPTRQLALESVDKPEDYAGWGRMFGVTDGKWKYISFADGTEALFDLAADPLELKNLAPNNLELVSQKRAELDALRKKYASYNVTPGEKIQEMERTLKALGY